MKIYMTGFVADKATKKLYENNKEMIDGRFPRFFVDGIKAMPGDELNLAKKTGCIYACTINKGGIYGALWQACEELSCGCEIFFDMLPIRQETIELAEMLGENPYEMESFGEVLVFEDGSRPERADPGFQFIGYTTDKKDRVLINKDNRRFLTPPERQDKDIMARKKDRGQV